MNKKYTTEEIRSMVKNLEYELVGDYVRSKQKIIISDNDGYLYAVYFDNLKRYVPNKFHKDNPYTIENLRLWLKLNYSQYELISSEYKNAYTLIVLKDNEGYFTQSPFRGLVIDGHIPNKFYSSNPYIIQNIKLWCKINNKPFELIANEYISNSMNLKWKYVKDGCEEIFEMSWANISQNEGCNLQVDLLNCLAIVRPDLAKEWHPTKNRKGLNPYNVSSSSGKFVWWQCSKNPKHEWPTTIANRNSKSNNTECPYCSHKLPSEEYNLLVVNPKLCEEWNYTKNEKNPEEYCPNSGKYIYWKCKECNHEWKTRIIDRSGKRHGCPQCSEPRGEKRIREYCGLKNIYNISQKTFNGLVGIGNGLLSYDHYLLKYNLLIEYQGEQHEKFTEWFHESIEDFERQQEHDRRKKEYALSNGYNFLEIWYWDYDNIESILENYFQEADKISLIAK